MAMSTLHPVSLPFLPTRNNTMDPDQRTRLLRTARKLQALLGTAPQVALLNGGYRSTKARKRHGVYGAQFSSSGSSLDSTSSEEDHVRARADLRQPAFSSGLGSSSPNRSQVPVANGNNKLKRSNSGRQPLAQPLLLRMSAVPVEHHRSKSCVAGQAFVPSSLPRPAEPVSAPIHVPTPRLTPFERRKLKVDSVLGPLSPLNTNHFPSSHSRSYTDLDLPMTPSLPVSDAASPLTGLSDREKRIKMAKLQRMMGENIPPELVFRETPAGKTLNRRSRSMSAIKSGTRTKFSPILEEPTVRKDKGKGKEIDFIRPLPPVPMLNPPPRSLPPTPSHRAPIVTQTTTTTTSSPLVRQTSLSMKRKGRKARPRSLTLGSSSALVAANIKLAQQEKESLETAGTSRGTVSLDEDRLARCEEKPSDEECTPRRSVERVDAPFMRVQEREGVPNLVKAKTEIWRRKEREWSGEWNVKDMEEVTKVLRGLRAS